MHTIKVIGAGFLLLCAFLLIGRAAGSISKAALYFLSVWLAGTGFNLWYGVTKAGYTVRDEAPIFLLVFTVPAAAALFAWWKLPVK